MQILCLCIIVLYLEAADLCTVHYCLLCLGWVPLDILYCFSFSFEQQGLSHILACHDYQPAVLNLLTPLSLSLSSLTLPLQVFPTPLLHGHSIQRKRNTILLLINYNGYGYCTMTGTCMQFMHVVLCTCMYVQYEMLVT